MAGARARKVVPLTPGALKRKLVDGSDAGTIAFGEPRDMEAVVLPNYVQVCKVR